MAEVVVARLALGSGRVRVVTDEEMERAERWHVAMEEWLANFHSAGTRKCYAAYLRLFIQAIKVPMWAVTMRDVIAYRDSLMAAGNANTTIRTYLACVSSFYTYATQQGLIQGNPVTAVKRPKVNAYGTARWVKPAEVQTLLASIDRSSLIGLRDHTVVLFLWTTGFRSGSVRAIRLRDLTPLDGTCRLRYWPKGGEERTRLLPASTWTAVKKWIDARRGSLGADDTFTTDSFLFCPFDPRVHGIRGERTLDREMSETCLRRMLERRTLTTLGRAINPHAFRHGAATELDRMGRSVKDIQPFLDHKNPATTLGYLQQAGDDRHKRGDELADSIRL